MAVLVLVCGVVRLLRGGGSCLCTWLVYIFACGSPGLGVRQSGLVYAAVRVCMSGLGHWRTGAIACGVTAVGMGAMPHLAALAL